MPSLYTLLPTTLLSLALLFAATMVRAECGAGDIATDPMRIAISGMPLLVPQQARVGAINGADVRFPQLLVAGMNIEGRHVALDYSHLDLRSLVRPRGLFSSQEAGNEVPWDLVELPAADYFLTGVIENVGLAGDSATSFFGRYVDRSLALMDRRYNQPRRLSLVIELFDAASGELVMQRRYVSQANWDLPRRQALGIDSPKVWQAEYGQELLRIGERVVADIEESISCAATTQAMLDS